MTVGINRKISIIVTVALLTFALAWNLKPRSFEGKRQVAFVEFGHYLDMNNMKQDFFRGPFLDLRSKEYTEFYWKVLSSKGDSGILSVLIPPYPLQESIVTYSGDSTAWNDVFNTDPDN
jgi:hypothetical protein